MAVAAAAVAACAALTALVFWLLDLLLGDMPSPWWGALGGALAAVVSYVRTGRRRPPA